MKNTSYRSKIINNYSQFLEKYLGAVISIALNLLLFAILSYIVFYTEKPAQEKFKYIAMEDIKIPEINLEPASSQDSKSSQEQQVSKISATPPQTRPTPPQSLNSTIPHKLFSEGQTTAFPAFDGGFMSLGDSITGGIHGNPFENRKKQSLRNETGKRDKRAKEAVKKALDWLKKKQNQDGSWGNGFDKDMQNAVSSLAVLAFLSHGENTDSHNYGSTVKAGLKNLLNKGSHYNHKGFLGGFGEALLTYVIAEGASMTFVPELTAQTRNRTLLISKQLARFSDDTSHGTLSPWNYQAIKAACYAVPANNFKRVVEQSAKHLLRQHQTQSTRTLSSSNHNTNQSSLDSIFARTYCLQLFGYTKHPSVVKYLNQAVKLKNGKALKVDWNTTSTWPLYAWYYKTNSLFFASSGKGYIWRKWYGNVTDGLLDNQNSDGSFYSPEGGKSNDKDYMGNGETVKTFGTDDNLMIYSTAICALILQVKHRYLPSYCGIKSGCEDSSINLFSAQTNHKLGIDKIKMKYDI